MSRSRAESGPDESVVATKPVPEGVSRVTSADHEFLEDAVAIPAGNPKWHPLAKALYASLAKSGQTVLYEPSDWGLALIICESLSRDLRPQYVGATTPMVIGEGSEAIYEVIPLKGASLTAYLRALGALGVTVGDRRNLKIEIERGPAHTGLAVVRDIASTREEAMRRAVQ